MKLNKHVNKATRITRGISQLILDSLEILLYKPEHPKSATPTNGAIKKDVASSVPKTVNLLSINRLPSRNTIKSEEINMLFFRITGNRLKMETK